METYMLCRSGSAIVRRKSNRNYLALRRIVTGLECAAVGYIVVMAFGFMFVLS